MINAKIQGGGKYSFQGGNPHIEGRESQLFGGQINPITDIDV